MFKTKAAFTLMRDEIEFMHGSFSLLAVVFNHLNGSVDDSLQGQRRYQATMGPALMGGELKSGNIVKFLHHGHEFARYVIGDPIGDRITERTAFMSFMDRVAAEIGSDEVASVGFLQPFRDGLTAAEAVLQDRLDAGVLVK